MSHGNDDGGPVWEIDNGWDVYSSDGDKLGSVDEVHPHYIVVGKGFIFHSERYVPVSAITRVERQQVYVRATKDQIDSLGWDTIPDTSIYEETGTAGGRWVTDRARLEAPVVDEEVDEEPDARTRAVGRGAVDVDKDVVEEVERIDVPLREETLRVSRRPVGDETIPAGEHAFQEEDIEIPLRGEEADVSKRAIVREQVEVSKDVRERDEQTTGTVRLEEVHVEGENRGRLRRP